MTILLSKWVFYRAQHRQKIRSRPHSIGRFVARIFYCIWDKLIDLLCGLTSDDNVKQNFLEPLHHLQSKDLKEVRRVSREQLPYLCSLDFSKVVPVSSVADPVPFWPLDPGCGIGFFCSVVEPYLFITVPVPVPVPVLTFEKLWFRFRFLLLKKLRFRFRFRFQLHI